MEAKQNKDGDDAIGAAVGVVFNTYPEDEQNRITDGIMWGKLDERELLTGAVAAMNLGNEFEIEAAAWTIIDAIHLRQVDNDFGDHWFWPQWSKAKRADNGYRANWRSTENNIRREYARAIAPYALAWYFDIMNLENDPTPGQKENGAKLVFYLAEALAAEDAKRCKPPF